MEVRKNLQDGLSVHAV